MSIRKSRSATAFDSPAPVDDKGVGETVGSGAIASRPNRATSDGGEADRTIRLPPMPADLAADLYSRYLADALGLC